LPLHPLSLHDALPIFKPQGVPVPARILRQILNKSQNPVSGGIDTLLPIERTLQKFKSNAVEVNPSYQNDNAGAITFVASVKGSRSEEHTSELQSRENL